MKFLLPKSIDMEYGDQILAERRLQGRLQYVSFLRLVWMCETFLFLLGLVTLYLSDVPYPVMASLMLLQLLRVLTEALNYDYVAAMHNVRGLWRFLWPFA